MDIDLNASFADGHHASMMKQLKVDEIRTFERAYDRIAALKRIEA